MHYSTNPRPEWVLSCEYACFARAYDVRRTAVINTWFVYKYMASVSRCTCGMDWQYIVVRRSTVARSCLLWWGCPVLRCCTAITGELAIAQVGVRILSGCLIGLTVNAMLLGHWYLNAPGMRVDVLRRSIDQTLFVWGLLFFLVVAMFIWQFGNMKDPNASLSSNFFRAVTAATSGVDGDLDATGLALLWLRWLAGLIGLPILLLMSRLTLEIPNTQSATGILYVACLAVILGELTAQLLGMTVKRGKSVAQPAQIKCGVKVQHEYRVRVSYLSSEHLSNLR